MKNKFSYIISIILIIAITMLFAFTFSKLNTRSDGNRTDSEQEVTESIELFQWQL